MRSTVELAHGLGMRVVAEGVEDAGTYALLTELGCDEAQGFYISRPLRVCSRRQPQPSGECGD